MKQRRQPGRMPVLLRCCCLQTPVAAAALRSKRPQGLHFQPPSLHARVAQNEGQRAIATSTEETTDGQPICGLFVAHAFSNTCTESPAALFLSANWLQDKPCSKLPAHSTHAPAAVKSCASLPTVTAPSPASSSAAARASLEGRVICVGGRMGMHEVSGNVHTKASPAQNTAALGARRSQAQAACQGVPQAVACISKGA